MNMKILIIIVSLSAFAVGKALAETAADAKKLATKFNQAQSSGDTAARARIYDEIVADKDVIKEIRENHKDTFALLQLEATTRKIERMEDRFGSRKRKRTLRPTTTVLQSGGPSSISDGGRSGAPANNSTYTQNFANQDRSPNRVTSNISNSRIRSTNSDSARTFSNRVRARTQSNQRRMRRR
ncbi:MAG: hypothetical protein K8I00_07210 [Candidatus Omnitrophica bacterium]|nr:hypothetical protein [Candidatus Omnitrophota bacterium]